MLALPRLLLHGQIVSTMATMGVGEVAAAADHPCLLFQLYVIRDRELVTSWVRQAEAAGYKALVITVDAQRLGRREADERNRCAAVKQGRRRGCSWLLKALPPPLLRRAPLLGRRFTLPSHLQLVNLLPLQQKQPQRSELLQARSSAHGSGLFELFAKEIDDSLTWAAIPWLRTITSLPIYVKARAE